MSERWEREGEDREERGRGMMSEVQSQREEKKEREREEERERERKRERGKDRERGEERGGSKRERRPRCGKREGARQKRERGNKE